MFYGVCNERNEFFGFVFMTFSRTISLECWSLFSLFISGRFVMVGDGSF